MSNKRIYFSSRRYVEITFDQLIYFRVDNNVYFRKTGPSFIGGYEAWYKKGSYFRKDGPSIIDKKTNKFYWYFEQVNNSKNI